MKSRLMKLLLIFIIIPVLFTNHAYGAAAGHSDEFLSGHWIKLEASLVKDKINMEDFYRIPGSGVQVQDNSLLLPVDGAVEFMLDVEKDGRYNLVLEYDFAGSSALKNTVMLKWEEQELVAGLPMLWKDADKNYRKDRYGNEMVPAQELLPGMHLEYIKDYGSLDRKPFSLQLTKGQIKFGLKNNTQPLLLKSVLLVEEKETPSYGEYAKNLGEQNRGTEMIVIEGENYRSKSDSYIRAANVQDSALSPYESGTKRINTINAEAWKEPGQKILWDFDVKKAGVYHIGFRYAQNTKQGMPVFRNIEIDGQIPLNNLKAYPFMYTGLGYGNLILKDADGAEMWIWLDEGRHTIAMEAETAPVAEAVRRLRELTAKINDISIDIKKLTGSGRDSNRAWDIEQYLPNIDETLNHWADEVDAIYHQLEEVTGKKPTFAVKLQMAARNLRELAQYPESIPNKLVKLNEGSGSASQLLIDLATELSEQPLGLDRIYIFGEGKLPAAKSGFFSSLLEGIKNFIASFFADEDFETAAGEDELEVWVARPVQYVEMLQSMADADFTSNSGIKVRFSTMPKETKLILSTSSKSNPDLALGISSHIPYELAIRGATADLSQFEDFYSYISREYNLETLIPYWINGKIYGVTETQDFFVLMYRRDILNRLKIPVPDTWDDVKSIMPELQRHSMGFSLPMSGWVGMKPLYTTLPFIYQNGGTIYSPDGLNTTINDEKGINSFKLMTEMFSIYNLEVNVPNFFNSFRYGTVPIGVANFTAYNTLMNAAPEIAGLWDMAVSPGVKDENGTVLRYQLVNDRADVIFENSTKKEQGWKLLKWWLSKEVQTEFANAMQTTYGPGYMWNTANLAAFEQNNFPEKHKKIILEQWKWAKEVARHPGWYIVEREISNAWTDIVMNGKNVRTSVDKAAINVDREIRRKLEEFGYIENGKVLSAYPIPTVDDIKERVKVGK